MSQDTYKDQTASLETFENIKNIAAAHARGDASTGEVKMLHQLDPELWRSALVSTKKELEVQMTAVRSRLNKSNTDCINNLISDKDRTEAINREMQWKSKATRFLASIETDILYVNYVIHAKRRRTDTTTTVADAE